MATTAPTQPSSSSTRRTPLGAAALLLIGAVIGAAIKVLVQFLSVATGDELDPAGAECVNAFDAFHQGERTSSLLQLVNDCTAEAR